MAYYSCAKNWIIGSCFAEEVEWQTNALCREFSESDLLREHAWVVLNSGFRESVVRKKFDYISLCYCDWESAKEIVIHRRQCVETASAAFNNIKKLEAMANAASFIGSIGFSRFHKDFVSDPISTLRELPYIGDVTVWHLAKNVGVNVSKPDRHLVRLAEQFGYEDAHEMCEAIHIETGDHVAVADLVLWRAQEQRRGHLLPSAIG